MSCRGLNKSAIKSTQLLPRWMTEREGEREEYRGAQPVFQKEKTVNGMCTCCPHGGFEQLRGSIEKSVQIVLSTAS